jgi:microcystin degradation protein MlrC
VPIIVALGGAHAFPAMAKRFGSWLRHRSGERSMTLTGTVNGEDFSIRLHGKEYIIWELPDRAGSGGHGDRS